MITTVLFYDLEDVGDKFYIVLKGEVMIELPDPEIPKEEFYLRYEEYKLLLKEMQGREDLKRKKKLVEKRKNMINDLLKQKQEL